MSSSPPPCRICGDRGSGNHYGVVTCLACKSFFKRTVQLCLTYRCEPGGGRCSIDRASRIQCQACRFQCCLRRGMRTQLVRSLAADPPPCGMQRRPVTPLRRAAAGLARGARWRDGAHLGASQLTARYGRDASQQAGYGRDASQQAGYGRDATQQAGYDRDASQQAGYGRDASQLAGPQLGASLLTGYGMDASQLAGSHRTGSQQLGGPLLAGLQHHLGATQLAESPQTPGSQSTDPARTPDRGGSRSTDSPLTGGSDEEPPPPSAADATNDANLLDDPLLSQLASIEPATFSIDISFAANLARRLLPEPLRNVTRLLTAADSHATLAASWAAQLPGLERLSPVDRERLFEENWPAHVVATVAWNSRNEADDDVVCVCGNLRLRPSPESAPRSLRPALSEALRLARRLRRLRLSRVEFLALKPLLFLCSQDPGLLARIEPLMDPYLRLLARACPERQRRASLLLLAGNVAWVRARASAFWRQTVSQDGRHALPPLLASALCGLVRLGRGGAWPSL